MRSQGQLSIQRMCELAGVSRAGFYRHWATQEPAAAETEIRAAVQRLALNHRYYGYRRIAALVQREGLAAGAKTVRRLMREDNLLAIRRRRFVVTTDSDHRFRVWPNLAQYLELTDINQLWVADFTFLRLEDEFVYLAVVLDAYPSFRGERHRTIVAVARSREAPFIPQPTGELQHTPGGDCPMCRFFV